jgi:hypothetical protein
MRTSGGKVIPVSVREATIKRRVRRHFASLGFRKSADGLLEPPGAGKEVVRLLHGSQRKARLGANRKFLSATLPKLCQCFASGDQINVTRISPVLQRISAGTWESNLFRLASLTWSVPVSNGFGRRLRYLIWDEYNGKLVGLLALGDPVFNLSARDQLIGWDASARKDRLVNVLDAYVVGAVPPYSALLAGKMVTCLIRSRDIYNDFTDTYGSSRGIISQKQKKARLLAVTTSSALGRSSIYNRLKLGQVRYLHSIGYTSGWGHFHIPDRLFDEFRTYLRDNEHAYADQNRFGQGPNWRLRTTRAALTKLGFDQKILRHGLRREIFISLLANNAIKLLRTGRGRPDLESLASAQDIAQHALERWVIPRSQRQPDFRSWRHEDIAGLLDAEAVKPTTLGRPAEDRQSNFALATRRPPSFDK